MGRRVEGKVQGGRHPQRREGRWPAPVDLGGGQRPLSPLAASKQRPERQHAPARPPTSAAPAMSERLLEALPWSPAISMLVPGAEAGGQDRRTQHASWLSASRCPCALNMALRTFTHNWLRQPTAHNTGKLHPAPAYLE